MRIEGQILYHGVDLYADGVDPVEVRRRIGMVFQKPNPFPKSIYDNVAFGPRVAGYPRATWTSWSSARCVAPRCGTRSRTSSSTPGTALSGGQQQRLCIARAIAVEPDVILMDEPCSALDPIATLKIEELMRELKQNYTIVIVTHNMQQAARASDYTAFLTMGEDRAGYLVEMAATEQLFTSRRTGSPRTTSPAGSAEGAGDDMERATDRRTQARATTSGADHASRPARDLRPAARPAKDDVLRLGASVEQALERAGRAWSSATPSWPTRCAGTTPRSTSSSARSTPRSPASSRPRRRWRATSASSWPCTTPPPSSSAWATTRSTSPSWPSSSRAEPETPILKQIPRMEQICREQLRAAMRALVDVSEEEARDVCRGDDEIDQLYNSVYEDAIADERRAGARRQATHMLFAAHHLERLGDRVTNIGEDVVYLATGQIEDLNP